MTTKTSDQILDFRIPFNLDDGCIKAGNNDDTKYLVWNYKHDEDSILKVSEICAEMFDGYDFVPGVLEAYDRDESILPFIVRPHESDAIVGIFALRVVKNRNDALIHVWLESVRVDKAFRGRGITTKIARLCPLWVDRGLPNVWFRTAVETGYGPMETVLCKARWLPIVSAVVWPSNNTFYEQRKQVEERRNGKREQNTMLERMNIRHVGLPSSDSLKWTRVKSREEIEVAMSNLKARGLSGWVHSFYHVKPYDEAVGFLEHPLADEEGRSVWKYESRDEDEFSRLKAILFARPIIKEYASTEEDSTIAVLAPDARFLDACIHFANNLPGFSLFRVVFESTEETESIVKLSPLMSVGGLNGFTIYERLSVTEDRLCV